MKLKNTLIARLQPVSFEIINLLLLLFDGDDKDEDVIGVGAVVVFVVEFVVGGVAPATEFCSEYELRKAKKN